MATTKFSDSRPHPASRVTVSAGEGTTGTAGRGGAAAANSAAASPRALSIDWDLRVTQPMRAISMAELVAEREAVLL